MLEILDQLPDSYLAFAGRLSEITARTMAYGIEGAGQIRYTFFRAYALAKNQHCDCECTIVSKLTAVKTVFQ
jgi:diacylglycerol kinase family enzyme